MLKTYQNLLPLASEFSKVNKLTGSSLSDLAVIYQKQKNPFILAYTYCKLFPRLKVVSSNYYYLNDDDKASYILEEIDRGLLNYDPTQKAQVQTLIDVYVNRRLYAMTSMNTHHNRKANVNADSYEEVIATKENEEMPDEYNDIVFKEAMKQFDLSINELTYCQIIMSNKHIPKDTEIAKKLGVSSMAVNYMKKRLQTKLKPLTTY